MYDDPLDYQNIQTVYSHLIIYVTVCQYVMLIIMWESGNPSLLSLALHWCSLYHATLQTYHEYNFRYFLHLWDVSSNNESCLSLGSIHSRLMTQVCVCV